MKNRSRTFQTLIAMVGLAAISSQSPAAFISGQDFDLEYDDSTRWGGATLVQGAVQFNQPVGFAASASSATAPAATANETIELILTAKPGFVFKNVDLQWLETGRYTRSGAPEPATPTSSPATILRASGEFGVFDYALGQYVYQDLVVSSLEVQGSDLAWSAGTDINVPISTDKLSLSIENDLFAGIAGDQLVASIEKLSGQLTIDVEQGPVVSGDPTGVASPPTALLLLIGAAGLAGRLRRADGRR